MQGQGRVWFSGISFYLASARTVISEVRGGWAFHFAGEFFFGFIPVRLIFSAFGDFG
jgi:hypothetical protein